MQVLGSDQQIPLHCHKKCTNACWSAWSWGPYFLSEHRACTKHSFFHVQVLSKIGTRMGTFWMENLYQNHVENPDALNAKLVPEMHRKMLQFLQKTCVRIT